MRWNYPKSCVIALCAGFIALSIVVQCYAAVNPDSGWHLYVASRLLEGKRLYIDIIEINFPFIYYLHVIPVLLSTLLPVTQIGTLIVFKLALVATGFVMTLRVMQHNRQYGDPVYRYSCQLALSFSLFVLPLLLSVNMFGQKEHLFMALMMPYIFSALCKDEYFTSHKAQRIAIGFLAALGICIKPFFVLIFFAVEAYLFRKHKNPLFWWRAEAITLMTAGAVYLLCIAVFMTDIQANLQLAVAAYARYEWYFIFILPFMSLHAFLFLFSVLAVPSLKESAPQRYFGLLFIVALTMASLQRVGMDYHFYPAMALVVLLLAQNCGRFVAELRTILPGGLTLKKLDDLNYTHFSVTLFTASYLLVITALGVPNVIHDRSLNESSALHSLLPYAQKYKDAGPVMVFGKLPDAFPLINYANAFWPWRFSSMWAAAGAEQITDAARAKAIKDTHMASLIADLTTHPPSLVIVNTAKHFSGPSSDKSYNYLEYNLKDPKFEQLWQNYRFLAHVTANPHYGFDLYTRK